MTVCLSHWKHYGVRCAQDSTLTVGVCRSRGMLYRPAERGPQSVLVCSPHLYTHTVPVCRSHRLHGAWTASLELKSHDTWITNYDTVINHGHCHWWHMSWWNTIWAFYFWLRLTGNLRTLTLCAWVCFSASVCTTERQVGSLHQISEGKKKKIYICMENVLFIYLFILQISHAYIFPIKKIPLMFPSCFTTWGLCFQ